MSLIFITGISTSGKSTIAKELSNRGYEAYDTEHNGMSAWFNKATGQRAAEFNEMPERTAAWLGQHEWRIDMNRIDELAQKARITGKNIILCGGGANEPEVRAKCGKVIWLQTNEKTIRERVLNPRDHDYGTRPHELAAAIESNARKESEYKAYGAILVDATHPLDVVISNIIGYLSPLKKLANFTNVL